MILVTLVTVIFHNLAVAEIIGVVISALAFAWQSAVRIRACKFIDQNGIKHYEIFGSTTAFSEKLM
jgi:sulfate permease, SulP family